MQQAHSPVTELFDRIASHWPQQSNQIKPQVILLYRVRDLLLDDLENVLTPFCMRPADLDVLVALRTRPAPRQLTPTELYRSLLLSSGGLTKILHRLQAEGWIDRPTNPRDGRSLLVRLTRKGKAKVEKVIGAVIRHEEHALAILTAREQAELTRLLAKLVAGWEHKPSLA